MDLVRQCITYGIFPLTFVSAMVAGMLAMEQGYHGGAVLATITVATVIIILIAERIHPHFTSWNRSRNDITTDSIHALVSMIAIPQLLEIGLTIVMLAVALALSESVGFAVWPNEWPVLVQLPLALIVSQFGEYWVHRGMHEKPLLWRVHATHHSPERLYWLNAARFHPFDTIISYTVAITPLLILGVPKDVMVLQTLWISVHGLFQHCNVHLKLGPLNYIFSMAELHRWHHSLKIEEANTNYGNNIIFWDIVFGTIYYPKDLEAGESIGLSDIENFPEDYLGQVASPFTWKRIANQ